MHFAYEGFTHNGDNRCFRFRATNGADLVGIFSIEIKLLLFSQNQVLVQEGPRFCLQMLETASVAEPCGVDRFRSYSVVSEDFRPLLVERARKLAEKAHKAPRKPFRKPALTSNLFLNGPSTRH